MSKENKMRIIIKFRQYFLENENVCIYFKYFIIYLFIDTLDR